MLQSQCLGPVTKAHSVLSAARCPVFDLQKAGWLFSAKTRYVLLLAARFEWDATNPSLGTECHVTGGTEQKRPLSFSSERARRKS